MTKAKILSWDEFREFCMTDAQLWHDQGWRSDKITHEDILNEYRDDYFDELTDDDISEDSIDYSLCSYFTPEEFAERTIEYMQELEAEDEE